MEVKKIIGKALMAFVLISIVFAFIITFAGQYVGQAFNRLAQIEYWVRTATGVVFIGAGLYYTLTHVYDVPLLLG